MACRDLRETRCPREFGGGLLVLGIGVSMHEHDRDRRDAVSARSSQRGHRRGMIERRLDRAIGMHPLRHLGNAGIEHRRFLDAAGEDLGPRLVADLQRIAESVSW